jgi:pyruvate formate lyase activating enzyme
MTSAVGLQELLRANTMPSAPELAVAGEGGAVRCLACGHRCTIRPGRGGVCRVRFNDNGQLRAPAGYVAGVQVDPIEKKPFFHAFPARNALSFGMLGCDLHCSYCQNWVTSQALRDNEAVSRPSFCTPEEVIRLAVEQDVPVMVSTYNEPLITADWAVEIFRLARAEGIVCGFVSNGNATPEVLEFIRPHVDLYKVDLKSFNDRGYRQLGGVLDNVLDTIRRLIRMDFWVEIVTLLVPGFNDGDEELRRMADFLVEASVDMPWHVTAFHPDYKMTDPGRTPAETLLRARQIGLEAGLRYVYAGNLPGSVDDSENTTCPGCSTLLIRRYGFVVRENRMRAGTCPSCGLAIPGRWEPDPPPRTEGYGIPIPIAIG